MSAPRATLETLFGAITTSWIPSGGLNDNGRKRKYGSRQASNAATGEAMKVRLVNGDTWTVRLVGSHVDFIDKVLAELGPDSVEQIWSERGTIYGKSFSGG